MGKSSWFGLQTSASAGQEPSADPGPTGVPPHLRRCTDAGEAHDTLDHGPRGVRTVLPPHGAPVRVTRLVVRSRPGHGRSRGSPKRPCCSAAMPARAARTASRWSSTSGSVRQGMPTADAQTSPNPSAVAGRVAYLSVVVAVVDTARRWSTGRGPDGGGRPGGWCRVTFGPWLAGSQRHAGWRGFPRVRSRYASALRHA